MRFLLDSQIDGRERICEFTVPLIRIITILNKYKRQKNIGNPNTTRIMSAVDVRQFERGYAPFLGSNDGKYHRPWSHDNMISTVLLETYNKKPVNNYFSYHLYNVTKEVYFHILFL